MVIYEGIFKNVKNVFIFIHCLKKGKASSIASKAKELGFTAEEIRKMSVDTDRITFTGVTDKHGNILPDGGHHASRAGRHFHNKLIADLKRAESKLDAKKIIARHHKKHMKSDYK